MIAVQESEGWSMVALRIQNRWPGLGYKLSVLQSPQHILVFFMTHYIQFSSVQLLSRVQLFVTPWIAAPQASLSITNSRSSLRLTSIELVMPSSHLILSFPSPPAPNPSQHQSLFQWVNSSHEVVKYWSFSFSISLSKEIPGLISFRMDWLDLLAVQGIKPVHLGAWNFSHWTTRGESLY